MMQLLIKRIYMKIISKDQVTRTIERYCQNLVKQYKFTKCKPMQFKDIADSLRRETCLELEYLSEEETEACFSSLMSKLLSGINLDRTDKEISTEINEFIMSIIRSPDEIEFLFPISNLIINVPEFKIGSVIIKKVNPDYEIPIRKSIIFEQFDPFIGNISKSIAVVTESGTNFNLMKDRAAGKVDLVLDLLRISWLEGLFSSDEEALFSRTELILFKIKDEDHYEFTWHKNFKPIQIGFNPEGTEKSHLCLKELSDNIFNENIPDEILELLKRAIFWISRSIKEVDLDLKIVCLCIALESMLTSKDKGKRVRILHTRFYY